MFRPFLLKLIFPVLFFCGLTFSVYSQKNEKLVNIEWESNKSLQFTETETLQFPSFVGCVNDPAISFLPIYTSTLETNGQKLINVKFENEEIKIFDQYLSEKQRQDLTNDFQLAFYNGWERKQNIASVKFLPLRINAQTGQIEKLVSCRLNYTIQTIEYKSLTNKLSSVNNSVLSSGYWVKLSVSQDGIYKIDANQLSQLGFDLSTIDPRTIQLYGNGGTMLPWKNSEPRIDDLMEVAIQVVGEQDGVFNGTDYILFYGQSPHQWTYDVNSNKYRHQKHLFTDKAFYFLTAGQNIGKRMLSRASSTSTPTHTVNSFDDLQFLENDLANYIKSGREWYGEVFDVNTTQTFNFNVPNLVSGDSAYVKVDVLARSFSPSSFSISSNAQSLFNLSVPIVGSCYTCDYGAPANSSKYFVPTSSTTVPITIKYNQPSSISYGYLNYIELVTRRSLNMNSGQLLYRDAKSSGVGNLSQFDISSTLPLQIWDITQHNDVVIQLPTQTSTPNQYRINTDSLLTFAAFNGTQFFTAAFEEKILNQNLHGLSQADYIIVSPSVFKSQADRLADLHRQHSNLTVHSILLSDIYNEFSGGAKDLTAIREFVRMFYKRAQTPEELPKYLLLFGDGSYDNRDRLSNNTAFVPTFQSANSYSLINSYVSDDFFGLMDDNEGEYNPPAGNLEYIDLGIGRFPVASFEEARQMVDKVYRYVLPGNTSQALNTGLCGTESATSFGDWRNRIVFVGDDEDGNTHLNQSDQLAKQVDTTYKSFLVDKIYFDAYQQFSTPGGQRYPAVKDLINQRVSRGSLFMNYIGHGGELGWAHERVLELSDIESWSNPYQMAVFLTATCEFSRYDDPGRVSAGELTFLKSDGGAIALLTTTRLAYSSSNFGLNLDLFSHLFEPVNGEMPRLSDVFMKAKRDNAGVENTRNYALLGDPALLPSYPKHKINVTKFNQIAVSNQPDTIKALSKVTVSGEVRDINGNKLTNFNGIVYPTVFDKPSLIESLANDPGSFKVTFEHRKNVLHKGKATVTNGEFEFSFIVPKDINYQYGIGKISFYAFSESEDASGFYDNLIVGGISDSTINDNAGPKVSLYLNDENFVFGGITNASPTILAIVEDENGINTTGSSIGHDITAQLDNNPEKVFVLNEYYESDLNSFQSGRVSYPLSDLSEGVHTIKFKIWDIVNNSTEVSTEFIVASSEELAIEHVLNYPNPFTTRTQFFFEHNRPCENLLAQIQIYTVSGRLVKSIHQTIHTEGFRSTDLEWDGRDDFGDQLAKGVYLYRLKISSPDGEVAEKLEKLVLLK